MRVISIGGTPLLVRGLRAALELRGHNCEAVGCQSAHPLVVESDPLPEVPFSGTSDATIIHGFEGLLRLGASPLASAEGVRKAIDGIRAVSGKVILYISNPVTRSTDPRLRDLSLVSMLPEAFDFCLFSTYSDVVGGIPPRKVRWLPYPLQTLSHEVQVECEEAIHEPYFLHIPFQTTPAESSLIQLAFHDAKRRGGTVVPKIVSPDSITSEAALLAHLRESNLFVERIHSDSFGLLGVYAMLHGIPVACHLSQRALHAWRLIEAAPIYRLDESNLLSHLIALLEEPRALRDLARRARTYVESTFALERVALLLEQLLEAKS